MKKVILGILLIVLTTLIGYSAQGQTFTSGTYNNVQVNDNIVIDGTVIFTSISPNNHSITVKSGSIFTINSVNTGFNSWLDIQEGATVYIKTDLYLDKKFTNHGLLSISQNLNINGKDAACVNYGMLLVGLTTEIHGGTLEFAGNNCPQLRTYNLNFDVDNHVLGKGYIFIGGYYNNGGHIGWPGHPLTNSSDIYVYCPTAFNDGIPTLTFGSAHVSKDTNVDPCNIDLPITLTTFVGHYKGSRKVQFDWTVTMEHNVDRYEISQLLPDNSERIVAYTSSLGDTETTRNYSIVVTYAGNDINGGFAGMYCVFGIGLIVTVILKRKVIVLITGLFILGVGFTSCSKSNLTKETTLKQKGIYRLTEIDKDGTIKNFQYIQVSTNI